MKKIIIPITLIFILLLTTLTIAQELKEPVDLEKEIKYYEINETYDLTKYSSRDKEIIEKYNDVNKEISEKLKTKETDTKFVDEVKIINNTIANSKGGVYNSNLSNVKNYRIENRLIGLEKYNKELLQNETYKVSMYVGTHNVTYAIYRHPDYNASTDEILENNELLFYVTSYNGYLNYETDKFSVQYASFIPANMDYNDVYSVDLKNIFDPNQWLYATLQFTNPDTSSTVYLQTARDQFGTSDTHTNSVFKADLIKIFPGGTVGYSVLLQLTSYTTDHSQNMIVSVGTDAVSSVASDFLPVNIEQPVSNPPTNPTTIPNVNLVGNAYTVLDMNDYFNNYDTIRVDFSDTGLSQSVQLQVTKGGSSQSYTSTGSDILVYLNAYSTRIELDIQGKNIAYSQPFTVTAYNNDGSIADTMTVTVTPETPSTDPPTQTASFTSYTISGTNTQLLNMNNFFSGYDRITVSFPDTGTSTSPTLDASLNGAVQSFTNVNGDLEVYLRPYSTRIDLEIKGKNIAYSQTFTVTAYNDYGNVADTFTVTINEVTAGEIDLITVLTSYWKFDEVSGNVLDSHGTNDGTNIGATPNVAGKINTAYEFSTSANGINVPDSADLQLTGDEWSISLWTNFDTVPAAGTTYRLINKDDGNDNSGGYSVYLNGDIRIGRNGGTAGTSSTYNTGFVPNASQWYHIGVTWEKGVGTKFYVDGTLYGTSTSTVNNNIVGEADDPLTFGYIPVYNQRLDGKIDEPTIWNRALSSTEVTALYDIQVTGLESGSYPFDALTPAPVEVVLDTPLPDVLMSYTDTITIDTNAYFSEHTSIQLVINPLTDNIIVDSSTPYISSDYDISINNLEVSINSKTNTLSDTFRINAINDVNSVSDDFILDITEYGNKPKIIGNIDNILMEYTQEVQYTISDYYTDYDDIEFIWEDDTTLTTYFVNSVNTVADVYYNGDLAYKVSLIDVLGELTLVINSYTTPITSMYFETILVNTFGETVDFFYLDILENLQPPVLTSPIPSLTLSLNDTDTISLGNYFSGYDSLALYHQTAEEDVLVTGTYLIGDSLQVTQNVNTYTFQSFTTSDVVYTFIGRAFNDAGFTGDIFEITVFNDTFLFFEEIPDFYIPLETSQSVNVFTYLQNSEDIDYFEVYNQDNDLLLTVPYGLSNSYISSNYNVLIDYVNIGEENFTLLYVVGHSFNYQDELRIVAYDVLGNAAQDIFNVFIGDFSPVILSDILDITMYYNEVYTIDLNNYFENFNDIAIEFYNPILSTTETVLIGDAIDNDYFNAYVSVNNTLTIESKEKNLETTPNFPLKIIAINDFTTIEQQVKLTIKKYSYLGELTSSIFPSSDELSTQERLTVVFLTLAFIIFSVVLLSYYSPDSRNLIIGLGAGAGAIAVILFTMSGYIPVWIILLVGLLLVGLGVGKARQVVIGNN